MSFEGQSVFITGGGTGIGAGIARRFRASGARVALMGRRLEPVAEIAQEVEGLAFAGDAADAASVGDAMARAADAFGGLDVLVANAGAAEVGALTDTTDASWESSLRNNLTTAFVTSRAAMPWLIRSRGSIVLISSLGGIEVVPEMCGYVTAKHAVIGLTKSIAHDYGKFGVRANAICPGFVRTPMADATMAAIMHRDGSTLDQAYCDVTAHQPISRPATPEDVAEIAMFLASDAAAMLTGTHMVVDGGSHIVCAQMLKANFAADPRR